MFTIHRLQTHIGTYIFVCIKIGILNYIIPNYYQLPIYYSDKKC